MASPTDSEFTKKGADETFERSEDWTPVFPYRKGEFGLGEERVPFYFMSCAARRVRSEFKVFEELNNAEAWPVSKIIQRELDRERAKKICDDYLLAEGFVKFFPPLVAVLLPTDSKYLPKDTFGTATQEMVESVNIAICKPQKDTKYATWEEPRAVAGGIVEIPFEKRTGELVWDKRTITAVILDGQHRLHALREASATDQQFDDWQVPILVIDLPFVCNALGQTPIEVVRDLFVKINATPEEVAFARLILMNDRDALCSFAQVAVDDGQGALWPPAVPPELVDWHCDAGKHDSSESLTGIVTVYHVLLSAFMGGCALESVDDRTNATKVGTWVRQVNDRLGVDAVIEANPNLGASHTLTATFEAAKKAAEIRSGAQALDGDEEEESAIAFTYSATLAKIIRDRFRELYLQAIRHVFMELAPYKRTQSIADRHGVLKKGDKLHRYFRASLSGRKELLKGDGELRGRLVRYKDEMTANSSQSVLHTVMGQKAIFGALFDYLAGCGTDSEAISKSTEHFVKRFNAFYVKVSKSQNIDEQLFALGFRVPKELAVSKTGDLGKSFWRGIIQKGSADIDYGKTAVTLLKSIVKQGIDSAGAKGKGKGFAFTEEKKMIQRHVKLLLDFDETIEDAEKVAKNVVQSKAKAFGEMLG